MGSAGVANSIIFETLSASGSSVDTVFNTGSFATGMNNEVMRIGGNGKIGIGTQTPQTLFDINTESAEAMKLRINGEANQIKKLEVRHFDASEAALENNFIYLGSKSGGDGVIGITNNSGIDLDILTFDEDSLLTLNGGTPTFHVDSSGTGFIILDRGASGFAGRLKFATNDIDEVEMGLLGGTENIFSITDGSANAKMVVNVSSGNVGIGTSSPSAPLSFGAIVGDKIQFYDGSNVGIGIQANLVEFIGNSANNDWAFGYGTTGSLTRVVTIEGTGNVGIGTTSPTARTGFDTTLQIHSTKTTGDVGSNIKLTSSDSIIDGFLLSTLEKDSYIWNTEDSFLSFGTNNSALGS